MHGAVSSTFHLIEQCINFPAAAQKLQATTYPFVAFIALQARRSSSTSQSPVLTVLSRHQGPSIPSATAPTSARALVTHLQEHLLPRVTPYLTRVRTQATEREAVLAVASRERERERALRAEQDRAFEESARKDRERIERRRAEEREAQEAARRLAAEDQRAQEQARKDDEERARWSEKRMAWRRYGRRVLLPREPRPGEQGRGKTVRVGVRMPDGRRAVRFFGENDSLTAVYAFVDTLFIPDTPEFSPSSDPMSPPEGEELGEIGLLQAMEKVQKKNGEWFGFKLAMAYPRKEIHWEAGKKVGEVEGLGGGQLVVELYGEPKGKARVSLDSHRSSGTDNESDEYETESD
jgi:FAS-associated factor 2